jgi:arylsulfatase A-like enzyme
VVEAGRSWWHRSVRASSTLRRRWRSGFTIIAAGGAALGLSATGVVSAMQETWTPAHVGSSLAMGDANAPQDAEPQPEPQEGPPTEPAAAEQPDDGRPNIIVVYLDDMRVSDLEVMHNVRRGLAANGVTFTNSVVTTALCCPSRASLLTGQYAHNTGVLHNSPPNGGYARFKSGKQAARETVPIWLHDAGYRTMWFGKLMNHYPGTRGRYNVPRGFTDWYGLYEGPLDGVQRSVYRQTGYAVRVKADEPVLDERRATQVLNVPEQGEGQIWLYEGEGNHQTEVLMDGAVSVVERHDGASPLYLTLSLTAPHAGGDAPAIGGKHYEAKLRPVTARPAQPELERLESLLEEGSDLGELGLDRLKSFNERSIADKPELFRQQPRLTAEDIEDIEIRNALRLASLQSVDRRIPDLLSAIEAAEQRTGRPSYVVFTSDNGFFLGEHRMPAEKNWHYGASTDVPLIISGPGVAHDVEVDAPVANIDLAPTFVQMAGDIDSAGNIDGRSLLPLLQRPGRTDASARWKDRAVLLEGFWGSSPKPRYAAVRTRSHVYVEHYAQEDGETLELTELYDRNNDPSYERNLLHGKASSRAEAVAARLAPILDRLKACSGVQCREEGVAPPASSSDTTPQADQGGRRKRKTRDSPPPATVGPPLTFESEPDSQDHQRPPAPGPEPRPPPAPASGDDRPKDTLRNGERLNANETLVSRNGKYTLVMQDDGNLVAYRNGTLPAVWSSGTHGHDGENAFLVAQTDGNVVVYSAKGALWSTRTHGRTGTVLIMQDNGVVGAWAKEGPVWASGPPP